MKTYNPDACCGADCIHFRGGKAEPCWGDVIFFDEYPDGLGDYISVHECEGHWGCFDGTAKYKPENNTLQKGDAA